MNKRKGIIIFICIAVVIMAGGKTYHDTKNKSTENYSEEKKDKSTEKKNETNLATNNQGKLEEISKKRTVKEKLGNTNIIQGKTVSPRKPEKWKGLKKGNAQENNIIYKDLSYLEKKYLYKPNEVEIQSVDLELEKLYGYKSYEKNENAQHYYRVLNNAMKNFIDSDKDVEKQDGYYLICILNYMDYGISEEEAINIYSIYRHDHPSYYWLSTTIIFYNNRVAILTEEDYALAKSRAEYDEKIDKCINKFVLDTAEMNQDEKVQYVHDTIIKNTEYAYKEDGTTPEDANWAHNIVGYVCNKGVVCEGYAKMFQLVLNELDIGVIFVTGSGNNVDHAWNLVQMSDSKWYCIDLTWDDTPDWNEDGVSQIYFCCPKSIFSDTHIENTTQSAVGKYLYDLPEISNEFTYYCANADNTLKATDSIDIMSEAIDKTKTEVEKGNNCVIFNVKNEINEKFLLALFSGCQEKNGNIITCYQMFMDTYPETVGRVSEIKYTQIGNRYYIFFQNRDNVKPIVTVKKNKKKIGKYKTLVEAFAVMTDSTADYQVELINDIENLVFPMHTTVPNVNSLALIGCRIPVGSSYTISRLFLAEDLFLTKDFKGGDLDIESVGYWDENTGYATATINVGKIDFTTVGDDFLIGNIDSMLGEESCGLKAEKGSKFILDNKITELNCSAFLDEVICKKGKLIVRGQKYNFNTVKDYTDSEIRWIEFANLNRPITMNIGDILAHNIIFDVAGKNVINIEGDIYCGNIYFWLSFFNWGDAKINIKNNLFGGKIHIEYVMLDIPYKNYDSIFFKSYLQAVNIDKENIGAHFTNYTKEFNPHDYVLQKNKEGNIYLEKKVQNEFETEISGNYVYRRLEDGTCELVEEKNNNKLLTIPECIEEYPVSKISDKALRNNENFLCSEENDFFTVDEGVLYSKDKKVLYRYSESNTQEIYNINNKTEIIKSRAFRWNEFIKQINIPSSVKKIEEAFASHCLNLEMIFVSKDNIYYSSKEGVLFDKNIETLLFYPNNKKDVTYEVPLSVVKIMTAISNKNIVCFKVDEKCKYIEGGNYESHNMKRLYLPDSLEYIDGSIRETTTIYSSSYKVAYEFAITKKIPFVLINGEFASPSKIDIQTNQSMVQLNWSRSAKASEYQIYRKEPDNSNYELIDSVSDLEYLDTTVVKEKEYLYYIVAVQDDLEKVVYSEPSIEVSIIVSDRTILDEDKRDMQGISYLLDEDSKTAQVGLTGFENTSQYEGFKEGVVVIPSSVEYEDEEYQVNRIGNNAFCGNQHLKWITIPEGVVSIGRGAFSRSNLTEVEIPKTVREIQPEAFADIDNLKNIFVDKDNQYYSSEQGVLFSKDKTILVAYPDRGSMYHPSATYIVPDSVTQIEDYAFYNVYAKIYLPDTIEKIGEYSLASTQMEEVNLENVIEIGQFAFAACRKLKYINLGNKLKKIGQCCFTQCSALEGIYIPDSVAELGTGAFYECVSLKYVVGCKNIKWTYSFLEECKNLQLLMLPEGTTTLPASMIDACVGLEKLYIPDSVTELSSRSLTGASDKLVLYGKKGGKVEQYANKHLLNFEDSSAHTHDFEWVVLEEQTDARKGLKISKCNTCNFVNEISVGKFTEHNWGEWEITEEASCEEDGKRIRICKDCDSIQEQVIEKRGHRYGIPKFEWRRENYCVFERKCVWEDCGEIESGGCHMSQRIIRGNDSIHSRIIYTAKIMADSRCSSTHEEIIHVAGDPERITIEETTCTNSGYYQDVTRCTICNVELSRKGYREPMKGHIWSDEYVVEREPTCTETGLKAYKCTGKNCKEINRVFIEPLGHDISDEWTVDKESTCIEEGEKSHHCKRKDCDYKTDVTKLSLADHTWSKKSYINVNPTCTTKGVREYRCTLYGCNAYKEEDIEALGHDMSPNWTIDKRATCIEKGEKSHHCMRRPCAYREDVTEIEYTEHLWRGIYTVIEEPTCTKEGLKRDKCKVCREFKDEKIEALGHDISGEWTVDKNATCAEEGEKSHHCRRKECEEREDITVIPATEKHIYDSGKIILKPNYTQKGIKLYICTYCKHEYRESIPELKNIPGKGRKIVDTKNQTEYIVTKAAVYGAEAAYAKAINKNITSVIIPAEVTIDGINYKVTSISKGAFQNNKKVKKIIIGKNIKTIGDNAFSNCNKLKQVSMGNNVITIGNKAFYKCNSLIKFTFPISVRKIGKQAFSGCKNLKMIIINTPYLTKKSVGAKAFKGIHAKATIKVPKKQKKAYQKFLKSKGIGKKVKIK